MLPLNPRSQSRISDRFFSEKEVKCSSPARSKSRWMPSRDDANHGMPRNISREDRTVSNDAKNPFLHAVAPNFGLTISRKEANKPNTFVLLVGLPFFVMPSHLSLFFAEPSALCAAPAATFGSVGGARSKYRDGGWLMGRRCTIHSIH
jgi:hypothetical protein